MHIRTAFKNRYFWTASLLSICVVLSACWSSDQPPSVSVQSALGGIHANETLQQKLANQAIRVRNSALLGIYVARYVALNSLIPVRGAMLGLKAQNAFALALGDTVADPDFDLLQALTNALLVDIADMLNRSVNRQEALDRYVEALKNVGTRATNRYTELKGLLSSIKEITREQTRQKETLEKEQRTALENKDFTLAGEKQKKLIDIEKILNDTDIKRTQTESIVEALDTLINVYGQRLLAIEKNREALIIGTKVVDVPGATDLKVLESDPKTGGRRVKSLNDFLDFGRGFKKL